MKDTRKAGLAIGGGGGWNKRTGLGRSFRDSTREAANYIGLSLSTLFFSFAEVLILLLSPFYKTQRRMLEA
jgi:hypothetical protein